MSNILAEIFFSKKSNFTKLTARFLYGKFLKPKSGDEDLRRREFIANIVIACSLLMSIILSLTVFHNSIISPDYGGISFLSSLFLVAFFLFLYFLSRFGFFNVASYSLIVACLIFVSYAAYVWGVDLPIGLLAYALLIILSGILVNTRFAFVTTFFIFLITLTISYFQLNKTVVPQSYWRNDFFDGGDIIKYGFIFFIMAVISWLSNREIESSLKRARKSEVELKIERDMLEIRVKERTSELEKLQAEKMNQAARFIEFGKLSSGLFHDLTNHISFLFLNIDKAASFPEKELGEAKKYLQQLQDVKGGLDNYLQAVKRQFQKQNTNCEFSLQKEINNVLEVLKYRAKMLSVDIEMSALKEICFFGNAIKFNHVVSNLVVNSLDAYEEGPEIEKRKISIELSISDNIVRIVFQDWAGGISEKILPEIFDPFFSTKKSNRGTGIGLSIVKDSLRSDFDGTIEVQSEHGKGTKFVIKFPVAYEKK